MSKQAPKRLTPAQARKELERGIARVQELTRDKPVRQQELALQQFYAKEPIQRLQRTAFGEATRREATRTRNFLSTALGAVSPVAGLAARAIPDAVLAAGGRATMESGTLGLADRLAAAGRGEAGLEAQRAETRFVRSQSPVAALVGDIAGGATAGAGAVGAVRGLGALAARTGTQAGRAVSRAATGATTLRQGESGRNVAKVALGGGTMAALDAAGRGEDIATAAAIGAASGPIVLGGLRLGQFIGQKAGDIFDMTGGPQALRRIVTEPMNAIQARIDEARRNGVEPTIFEVLSATDRRRLAGDVVARSDETRQAAQTAVQARGATIAPTMRRVAEEAAAPQRQQIVRQIEQDIAASQGAPVPQAATLATEAARAPQNVRELAAFEAEGFMAPVARIPVARSVDEFFPKAPQTRGDKIVMEEIWPELNATIRSAFGRLALKRDDTAPITVEQANAALSKLRDQFGSSDRNQAELARQASEVIEDIMRAADPRVGEAVDASRRAFFNRASMGEGMAEGGRTRLFEDIPDTGPAARQDVRNAFGTDWGSRGRALGQENRLLAEFSGTPDEALRRTEQIAQSLRVQGALAQNLGQDPAEAIARAAQQQELGMQNIAEAARVRVDTPEDALPLVGRAVLALSPSSLPSTKIWGLTWLANFAGVPEPAARQIVDRVFSQDPQVVEQTLRFLRDRTDYGEAFMRDFLTGLTAGQQGARVAEFMTTPQAAPVVEDAAAVEPEMAAEPVVEETAPVEGEVVEIPEFENGAQVVSFLWPEARITDHMRDPNSPLGRKNPFSAHIATNRAVDVAPIPGVTFQEFVQSFEDAGFMVKYARDEVNNPTSHATGPHWHIELE